MHLKMVKIQARKQCVLSELKKTENWQQEVVFLEQ